MSIATAIAAAQQKVANAYTAVSNKGGTLPATQNLSNLPTAINSISGGVSTTGWIPRTVSSGVVSIVSSLPDLTGITEIGNYVYPYAYYNNSSISGSINFSNITTIGFYGCYHMFDGAYYITSVNLNNLSTIRDYGCSYMFYSCTSLASASLSALTTISGYYGLAYAFGYCSSLTSANISIPNLTTISGSYGMYYTFRNCTSLTTFTFSKLSSIAVSNALNRCFYNCTSLTSLYFPKLNSSSFGSYTTQFANMLYGCSGVTVHFPSNLQSVIGSWSDVTNGFAGTNTTVLYDLTATS